MFLMAGWQNPLNQLHDFLSGKRKMLSVAGNNLCQKNSYSFNSEILQIMHSCLISYQVMLLWGTHLSDWLATRSYILSKVKNNRRAFSLCVPTRL